MLVLSLRAGISRMALDADRGNHATGVECVRWAPSYRVRGSGSPCWGDLDSSAVAGVGYAHCFTAILFGDRFLDHLP